jgi:hypothetical protein
MGEHPSLMHYKVSSIFLGKLYPQSNCKLDTQHFALGKQMNMNCWFIRIITKRIAKGKYDSRSMVCNS